MHWVQRTTILIFLLGSTEIHAQSGRTLLAPRLVETPGWYGPGRARTLADHVPDTSWQYPGLTEGPFVSIHTLGFPAGWGSFWSNGLSRYGPPIPTYGPVPGTFGASDVHRYYQMPPYLGLGWWNYRSPGSRYRGDQMPLRSRLFTTSPQQNCCQLHVTLPHDQSTLTINGVATEIQGKERLFESPALRPQQNYQYELMARWPENGKMVEKTKKVLVQANAQIAVDFTR